MCGRYGFDNPEREWLEVLGAWLPGLEPRYNLAPTQLGPVVRPALAGREAILARWGLVPASFPSVKHASRFAMFNARAETVATSPAFRDAYQRRRCLVPASFFYEWRRIGGTRWPYRIGLDGGEPFAMAGVWERWERDDESLESYAILTTTPNELVSVMHDRMPVILAPADHEAWLDPAASVEQAEALLRPYPARGMDAWPVSRAVGSVREDSAELASPM